MKMGVQTSTFDVGGYGRWGENTYKKLKEHGYSCADFDMSNTDSLIYTLSQEESDALLIKEKNLALEAGIEINQVHGPWRWPARDFEPLDRAERIEKMKKSIRATSVLGCKYWVVHPFMPFGVDEIGTDDAKKTWDINVELISELLKTAKEYDITICLENMPMLKFSLAKPEEILRFVKTINDDHLKICLDTGHVSVFYIDVAEAVRMLGNEIKVLHIHDNKFGCDLHLMPRYGIINWEEFAKSLKDISFDGVFSLETLPPRVFDNETFENLCNVQVKVVKEIMQSANL